MLRLEPADKDSLYLVAEVMFELWLDHWRWISTKNTEPSRDYRSCDCFLQATIGNIFESMTDQLQARCLSLVIVLKHQ